MPFFTYSASDNSGVIKTGQMEAVDKKTVIDYLKSENLLVITVNEKSTGLKGFRFSKKITYLDKITFTGNLSTMIKAGVNLSEALDIIGSESPNEHFKNIINDLKFSIENGKPLSDGLSHYTKDFDPIFINLIKAGEASGKLDDALARLNIQLKKEYSLISKVKNALIYPVVLIVGVLGVLVLIITFVIPKLVTIFEGSTLKIPLTTRLMFFLAKVFGYNPILTIVSCFIIFIALAFIIQLPATRRLFNRMLAGLPVTKELLKNMELVRFCRTTSGLLASGIPIGQVMEITANSANLPRYKEAISSAREKILKGVSVANSFKGTEKLFPPLLISVINVGERTGQLDKLVANLADFYEEQADNTLKTMASLVEPVLLVIVGLLIGGMAVSIVVPIYQLIGTV